MTEPEDDEPTPCENCGGDGEVGPYGWEFPEWETCPDCRGSGLERDHQDPDEKFDRLREDGLL